MLSVTTTGFLFLVLHPADPDSLRIASPGSFMRRAVSETVISDNIQRVHGFATYT
jgi:hypothetical protein